MYTHVLMYNAVVTIHILSTENKMQIIIGSPDYNWYVLISGCHVSV